METRGWNDGYNQGTSQSWFEQGERALEANMNSEAVKCFGEVLKTDPFSAKAYCRLSNAYWSLGKTEEALNSLTRALELEPNDRDTVIECSRVFAQLGKKDFSKEVLQSYLERNPHDRTVRAEIETLSSEGKNGVTGDTAEFFLRQGELQFERGNPSHAIACFEMAIENNPSMAEAHNNLGVLHMECGRLKEALELFYKALELKPQDIDILNNSAKALALAGQWETAAETYKEYLRHAPEDEEAWNQYESLIRMTGSQEWDPKGLSSDVAAIYIQMAEKLLEAGDHSGATTAITRALQINPTNVEALFILASLHKAIGQRDEAVGVLEQALQLDPSHVPSSDLLNSISNSNGSCGSFDCAAEHH